MKFKNTFLITLAAVFCTVAFSIPASANVSNDAEISVNDSTQSKTPLTPNGNMTTIDDVHQVNDKDTIEDKQFITVESKNGNTFYIIIDRSGDTENVYFLNAVDEADLMALMEDEQKAAVTATCNCTTKCELGSIKSDCAVCSKNKNNCIAPATATPIPDEKEKQPEGKQNSATLFIGLVLIVLLGGGGAFYWFNIKNKKSSTKGTTDPADLYEEDDEDYETESEDAETETDSEQDYEIEDEDSDIENSETSNEESEEFDE